MAFQQSVGINGIGFYTAETFVAAGKWDEMHTDLTESQRANLILAKAIF
jgi:hypothetical protein